jgi:hypothetical protein
VEEVVGSEEVVRPGTGFKETTLPLNLAQQQQMPSIVAASFPSHLTPHALRQCPTRLHSRHVVEQSFDAVKGDEDHPGRWAAGARN